MNDYDKIMNWAQAYAGKNGFALNPDKEILEIVIHGLSANRQKHGKQYCPCRMRTGDEEEDKKIICPCVSHKEEIERDGRCHCALFFKG